MSVSHVFLDLDDVACDWAGAALRLHGLERRLHDWPKGEWDIPKVLGMTDDDFCRPITELGARFWADLEPLPWMNDLVEMVDSFTGGNWSIATAPNRERFPDSPIGKAKWIRAHLHLRPKSVFTGEDKDLLSRPGHVLIDDRQSNCQAFSVPGGHGIVFPRPWNNRTSTADPVGAIRFDLSRL